MPSHDCCCAHDCSNRRDPFDKSLKFHRIPADPDIRREWISRINRSDLRVEDVTSSTRLCSEHFYEGCRTSDQPLPVYFSHKTFPLARKRPRNRDLSSFSPTCKRRASADHNGKLPSEGDVADAAEALLLLARGEDDRFQPALDRTGKAAQEYDREDDCQGASPDFAQTRVEDSLEDVKTSSSEFVHCDSCSRLQLRVLELERDSSLKADCFGVERFAADEKQFKYYTGLPSYSVFKAVYKYLEPTMYKVHKSSKNSVYGPERRLCMADELFMVLMRVRTGIQLTDLMYRFGFKSLSHVCDIFSRWILFLAEELSPLIIWPSRGQVHRNMPESFRAASMTSVRAILDCTEYEIEAPSALSLNAMTYSDYKSRNTVKVLFCITPDGFISHVSKAYPGSISDNAITLKSGILDMCEPGDCLMADKGFTLSNVELQPRGISLVVPPFRQQNKQFSPSAVKLTREIAALRITVENCILRVNYSRLLKRRLPVNTLKLASAIVKVGAVLANFRKPLRK